MATAEELLAAEMGDTPLSVNIQTRTIDIPASIKNIGVESDDDVLRLPFTMPRYLGDVDLSEFDIRINYLNAKSEGDAYLVSDAVVGDDDITFSWLVGRWATIYKGNVTFNVCLRKLDDEGIVTQEFNTTVCSLPVLQGLETDEAIVEKYPGVFMQLVNEAVDGIIEADKEYIDARIANIIVSVDTGAIATETVFPYGEGITPIAFPKFYDTIPCTTITGESGDFSVTWRTPTDYDGTNVGASYIFEGCTLLGGVLAITAKIVEAGWYYKVTRQGFASPDGTPIPFVIKGNMQGTNDIYDETGCNKLVTNLSYKLQAFGGSHNAADFATVTGGDTKITITDNAHLTDVYGGGHGIQHNGSTHIYINNATIENAVFAGGRGDGGVMSDAYIDVAGNTIIKTAIFGGSYVGGGVWGTTYVHIHDLTPDAEIASISRTDAGKLVVHLDDTSKHLIDVVENFGTDENTSVYINGVLQ